MPEVVYDGLFLTPNGYYVIEPWSDPDWQEPDWPRGSRPRIYESNGNIAIETINDGESLDVPEVIRLIVRRHPAPGEPDVPEWATHVGEARVVASGTMTVTDPEGVQPIEVIHEAGTYLFVLHSAVRDTTLTINDKPVTEWAWLDYWVSAV